MNNPVNNPDAEVIGLRDQEAATIAACVKALSEIDEEGIARTLKYLTSRFSVNPNLERIIRATETLGVLPKLCQECKDLVQQHKGEDSS